jgi:WD40 repeat protein
VYQGYILSAEWSLDGRRIVALTNGSQYILDAHTGRSISRAEMPADWDAVTGKKTVALRGKPAARVQCQSYSPDRRRIVRGEDDGTLRVYDAATGEEQMVLKGHTGVVLSAAFSWDGQRIISASRGKTLPGNVGLGELKLWDAVTGQEKLTLNGYKGPITSVAFSRDDKQIIAVGNTSYGGEGIVKVWEAPAAGRQDKK